MTRTGPRLWLAARQLTATVAVLSDIRSRARFVALRLGRGERGSPVPLRLKALAGRPLWVRPRTGDIHVLVEDYVHGFGDPPAELDGRRLDRIVELGTNIGAGLALLAERHPGARLVGVEADPGNAALALRNLGPWSDRAEVVYGAVWKSAGDEVVMEPGSGLETGFVARERDAGQDMALKVPSLTVEEVLEGLAPGQIVDYLYMDLEGTHQALLTGQAAWLDRVRAIKVAAHEDTPYSEHECARDLERHGFTARVLAREPSGWTIGVKP